MKRWYTFNDGNKGYFEAKTPFQYTDGDNVIGWLHDEEKNSLGMTTIPKHLLVPMGRFSLKLVNEYIQILYPEISLAKDNGYFYIYSDNDAVALKLAALGTTSISVCHLNQGTIEKWREWVQSALNDSQRNQWEREPVYPL